MIYETHIFWENAHINVILNISLDVEYKYKDKFLLKIL